MQFDYIICTVDVKEQQYIFSIVLIAGTSNELYMMDNDKFNQFILQSVVIMLEISSKMCYNNID